MADLVALPGHPRLEFERLDRLHYGVPREKALDWARIAAVCLSRHHTPPTYIRVGVTGQPDTRFVLDWVPPSGRTIAGNAEEKRTTEDGAYCLAIATVGTVLNYEVCGRTMIGTGADYYMVPRGQTCHVAGLPNFETAVRLEVSGLNYCNDKSVRARMKDKLEELRKGSLNLPGIACIVGFSMPVIAVEELTDVD